MERSLEMMRWLRALFGGTHKPDPVARDARLAIALAQHELNASRRRRLRAADAKYHDRLKGTR
jgi:hypothetical protein